MMILKMIFKLMICNIEKNNKNSKLKENDLVELNILQKVLTKRLIIKLGQTEKKLKLKVERKQEKLVKLKVN